MSAQLSRYIAKFMYNEPLASISLNDRLRLANEADACSSVDELSQDLKDMVKQASAKKATIRLSR